MKQFLLFFSLCLTYAFANAQSEKYENAMEQQIALFETAKSPADYQSLSASFERIANAEKNQWLPYYYAALAHVFRGFQAPKDQQDQIATEAERLLEKAEAIEPRSAEILIVRNMASTIHMLVDPQTRWQTYGAQAAASLEAAKKLDENNPRIYFLEGQSAFGTPVQFGGGKDKAKPLFEKSVALFDTYKPADKLYPNWGRKAAEDMVAQCK